MPVHQLSLPIGREREPAHRSVRRQPLFWGAKCPTPILHHERWQRDALIALALDPKIARLDQVDEPRVRGVLYSVGATLRSGEPIVLRFVENETALRWSQPCKGIAVIDRMSVLNTPGLEARRSIWQARDAVITATNRYRVATALAGTDDGLPLRDVIEMVSGRSQDVVETVCALACEDVIWIDVSRGLTPDARVRRSDSVRSDDGSLVPHRFEFGAP
jgi:hypothetical protein